MSKNHISYNDLTKEKSIETIKYSDLLLTNEWNQIREKVLKRDDYYCLNCGYSETLWHKGDLYSFDKKRKVDTTHEGVRITADHPFKSEKPIYFHFHHSYYVKDKLPWEYKLDSLKTLCNWCHWEFHENNNVPIYFEKEGELVEMNYIPCFRCNGAGIFPEYKHVENGICFRCNGSRYEELI